MSVITSVRAADTGIKIALAIMALLLIALLIFMGVGAWNDWQRGRTAKKIQSNQQTVATEQHNLDREVQAKEVETVRHESTITIRTQVAAQRLDALPVGEQLGPLLDELCGMPLYGGDPECASRVQHPGDGEEEVRGSAAPQER